jgi:hypothetical protein
MGAEEVERLVVVGPHSDCVPEDIKACSIVRNARLRCFASSPRS